MTEEESWLKFLDGGVKNWGTRERALEMTIAMLKTSDNVRQFWGVAFAAGVAAGLEEARGLLHEIAGRGVCSD